MTHYFARPAERVVSLVPSDTYTLARLGLSDRIVGRTSFCVSPESVSSIPAVGGTKDADVQRVADLKPDLVLVNLEENTLRIAHALQNAGIRTFATLPKTFEGGLAHIARLARLFGPPTSEGRALVKEAYELAKRPTPLPDVRVFVPIWKNPWMTGNGQTFLSSVLERAGGVNVFSERRRRLPLAADLDPNAAESRGKEGSDDRYPRLSEAEILEAAPELVLLPDEPFAFTEEDVAELAALDLPASRLGQIVRCEGPPLLWPGVMSMERFHAVEALVSAARAAVKAGSGTASAPAER